MSNRSDDAQANNNLNKHVCPMEQPDYIIKTIRTQPVGRKARQKQTVCSCFYVYVCVCVCICINVGGSLSSLSVCVEYSHESWVGKAISFWD